LRKPEAYQRFIETYKASVLNIIETGCSSLTFEGYEDAKDMEQFWKRDVYGLCLQILSSSMSLIYPDNSGMVSSLVEAFANEHMTDRQRDITAISLEYISSTAAHMTQIIGKAEAHENLIKVYSHCSEIVTEAN
jgi:hypothetical protein